MPTPPRAPSAPSRNRRRRLLLLAPLLGLVVPLAAVPAHAVPAAAVGTRAAARHKPVTTRIATYNIAVSGSVADVRDGVRGVLPHADILGLQEINQKDKAAVLKQFPGWAVWRQDRKYQAVNDPGGAEQTPVMWRTSRFKLISARPVRISTAEEEALNGEVPTYREGFPSWVSVVRLWDRATGQRISVIDVHLVPGGVQWGHPYPGHPRTWSLYSKEVARVIQLVRTEAKWGRVFTLGDFNDGWLQDRQWGTREMPVRRFWSVGMDSMWATKHPAKGKPGTHSVSLIDQVFATKRASDTKILFSVKHSDHFPAVATYQLTKH